MSALVIYLPPRGDSIGAESLHYGPTARRGIVDPVIRRATIVGSHHVEGVVGSNAGGFDARVGAGQGGPVTWGAILPHLIGPVVVGATMNSSLPS